MILWETADKYRNVIILTMVNVNDGKEGMVVIVEKIMEEIKIMVLIITAMIVMEI